MTATVADIEAVRQLLDHLGISPEQLLAAKPMPSTMPTFAEHIDRVSEIVTDGTRHAYHSYWERIRSEWSSRLLTDPKPLEIKAFAERARTQALTRRNSRDGRSAAEHTISAFRCLYKYAIIDGLITSTDNPASRVAKPRRLATARRALLDHQLLEIHEVAATTGNDPELDTLILRLHEETACRRGGALHLRPRDLDPTQCLILLREKGETERLQPVSPTLMSKLTAHIEDRGDRNPDGQLLRYRNHRPITTRRYDHIWHRLGQHLPWITAQQVTTHWLRYTTLTWIERNFGYAIARAYAGHTDHGSRDTGTTATYVLGTLNEVAQALATLTGQPHPLAPSKARHEMSYSPKLGAQAMGRSQT